MATGNYDADGFYHYGEDDLVDEGAGFSGVLNKAADAIPQGVRNVVIDQVNNDDTLRASALELVGEVAADLDIGAAVGVEMAYVDDPRARLLLSFSDDSTPITVREDGTLATREFETRYDIDEPGARTLFLFEDDSIAGAIYEDGSGLGGGSTRSPFPAAARGSSLTQGDELADPAGSRWTTRFTARTGLAIDNYAINGGRLEETAWHAGAHTVNATIAVEIPAAGAIAVPIEAFDVDPWRASSNPMVASSNVVAITRAGLVMTGTLSRTSSTTRTFTRTDGGAVVPAGAIVAFRARPATRPGQLLFLDTIANNTTMLKNGTQTLAQMKAWTREIVDRHDGPVAVWGLLDRGMIEAPGTDVGNIIAAHEEFCATELGDQWYPVRQYLATERALDDARIILPSFTPTQLDHDTVAAGAVPPSFRAIAFKPNPDSIHESELAHDLIALYFARELALRGITHA